MTVVEFVHWGTQCPWGRWAETQVRIAAGRAEVSFRAVDLSHEAFGSPVFFPFQWFVDGRLVTSAPVSADRALALILDGPDPGFRCRPVASLPSAACTDFRPLSRSTQRDSCRVCCNGDSDTGGKEAWFNGPGQRAWGFVGYEAGEPVATVELVPAADLPYGGFDRHPGVAAIVCLYSNHPEWSFQSALLARVIADARASGFDRLQVVSGRNTANPNGPEAFFLGEGFTMIRELGTVFLPDNGWETLVLMEKTLP